MALRLCAFTAVDGIALMFTPLCDEIYASLLYESGFHVPRRGGYEATIVYL